MAIKREVQEKEFKVLKPFSYDKKYYVGDIVLLSEYKIIKKLLINKYIK